MGYKFYGYSCEVKSLSIIPVERIESKIFFLRNQKVMLSNHLAELYGVETRTLIQAVKRNLEITNCDFNS